MGAPRCSWTGSFGGSGTLSGLWAGGPFSAQLTPSHGMRELLPTAGREEGRGMSSPAKPGLRLGGIRFMSVSVIGK